MTTLTSHIVTGSIVPGEIDPRLRRSYFTATPWGPPLREETATVPSVAAQLKPRPLGEEGNMMNILQKVMQKQEGGVQAPLKESVPANRTWRN
jgi:hypothetical protein